MVDGIDPPSPAPEREGRAHVRILQDRLGFRESLPGAAERQGYLREHRSIKWTLAGVSLALTVAGLFVSWPLGLSLGLVSWSLGLTPLVRLAEYASRVREHISRLRLRVREKLDRRPAIRLLGESPGVRCSDCNAPIRHPKRPDACRVCGSLNRTVAGQPAMIRTYIKENQAVVWTAGAVGLVVTVASWFAAQWLAIPLGILAWGVSLPPLHALLNRR